ncbi:DUF1648 domain-containing protein [Bacillus sp. FJAT-49705]|uniref:DUF1648 domain-containing protein n=1 Tax=Cytobacillus citreus TaxID=2833586 RepID=A0ABS5NS26_9BACI|nr:DUF1648 domain-containing protein [Cytobacillus citreus]MBS4190620.1 DUF1648 domain-containing protein [Cytobacillus citreus]
MSKFLGAILLVGFVISSFLIYPMLPDQIPNAFANYGEPSSYSSKFSVMISFGIGIFTVYLTMLFVSRIIQSKYQRFQKGIEGIFLIIILLLSVVYSGIIVNGLELNFNMLPLVPLSVGLSLIVTGNEIQRYKANDHTAIPLINAHNDLWNKVRHFVAKGLFIGGLLMLPCVFFPVKSLLIIFLTILGLLIAILLLGSYQIYKKHYINPSNKPF